MKGGGAMKTILFFVIAGFIWPVYTMAAEISTDSTDCVDCHSVINPGMVAQWRNSRHAQTTLSEAMKKPSLEKRVSVSEIPEGLENVAIGCAECHTLNPEKHSDTFDHMGYNVHVVVTPTDCATCHPTEVEQYGKNIMSHAYGNLVKNPIFRDLADSTNGIQTLEAMATPLRPPDDLTDADSCLFCHGTIVKVTGTRTLDTDMGDMEVPVLSGWPNQGSGRINPDGSMGACTICHTRHQFSIEMARKPYTCSQCHKGPDVPAYKVYEVSKHGNEFSSFNKTWNFTAVPWIVGEHFDAPTCATCHISLVIDEEGEVVAERTHQMNNRLPWRLMGLIYAHAHPRSPDTTVIQNKAGLPLPTELTGEPVAEHLIGSEEQKQRKETLQRVCLSCHGVEWVDGHWERLENTLKTTNEMTLTVTKIMLTAWDRGAARGLAHKESVFDEAIEKKWVEQWLFYANSTRFASAMMGGDYGAFANGRWYLSKNVQEMLDWLNLRTEGGHE
jgi:hydroxylamine dehydrogenase